VEVLVVAEEMAPEFVAIVKRRRPTLPVAIALALHSIDAYSDASASFRLCEAFRMRRGADVVLTFCNASAVSRSDVASITRRVALSSSDRHAFVIAPGRSRRSLSQMSPKATSRPRRARATPFRPKARRDL
jgi:hypothetical protein